MSISNLLGSHWATRRIAAPLALALLGGCGDKAEKPKPVAELISVEGQAHLTRGGKRASANPGPLHEGDLLETGPASSALIRDLHGRELELGEGTRFLLGERLGAMTVELREGAITSRGGGGEGQLKLSLLTPYGLTSVPSGAEATFTLGSGGLQVQVLEGQISFVDSTGKEQLAGPGQKLMVALGEVRLSDAKPPPEPPRIAIAPIELRLAAERGAPQLKRKGSPAFVRASKDPLAIEEGTAFRVPKSASASLEAEGVRIRLGGGTTGQVGAAVREGEERRYGLTIEGGEATLLFTGQGRRKVALESGGRKLELHVDAEASATLAQTKKGPRLSVTGGELELVSEGRSEHVKAGQLAELGKQGLKVEDRAAAPVVLPAERRVRVYANGLDSVAVSWPSGVDPSSTAQVATDSSFAELIAVGPADGGAITVPPPAKGVLHWRVLSPGGQVLHDGRALFDRDSERSALDLSHQGTEIAETGQVATVYFQSVVPSLTFIIPPHEAAARYRLRVWAATDLAKPIVEQTVEGTRCPLEAGALGEGSYVWYAAPLDATGGELAGGRMNKLEIVYDNKMTTLAIARPKPLERVGPEVEAAGVAPLGSRLYVNGRSALLDEKGRFSLRLPRVEMVVFRLVAQDGSESYWVRHVRSAR
ncbi:MAG: hypothetical protein HYZ28_18330 [Myxococcales bacterium]|nr:hypothetical protein [Myxococcales bacterium]